MHERGEAQSAGVALEHLGGRARDQPVEEHDSVVGDAPQNAVQRGEGRGVGRPPESGHGMLVHRPAQGGEPAADAAVIDVAAAGAGRVVDAVGNDGMHNGIWTRPCEALYGPHSGRS